MVEIVPGADDFAIEVRRGSESRPGSRGRPRSRTWRNRRRGRPAGARERLAPGRWLPGRGPGGSAPWASGPGFRDGPEGWRTIADSWAIRPGRRPRPGSARPSDTGPAW